MEKKQQYDLVLIGLIIAAAVVFAAILYLLWSPGGTSPPATPTPMDSSWQDVQASGVLRVGTSADYPPFEFYDSGTYQLDGFDVAMMREIGAYLGVQVEFEDIIFDALGEALLVDQVDTAVSAIAVTEERAQEVDFTNVYFVSEDAFLAPVGTDFTVNSPQDVVPWRVGVQRASVFEAWVRQELINTGQMPEANLFVYESAPHAVRDLNQGRLDLVIMDLKPAEAAVEQNQGRLAGQGLNRQRMAMAVPQGAHALRSKLNEALQSLYNNGRIHYLAQQYLDLQPDEILPTPTSPAEATPVVTATPKPCVDSMAFVNDVNLDDNNMTTPPQMLPGQAFTKIWRIRNTGTCTWDSRYVLNYVGGNVPAARMGGVPTPITGSIPPGSVYDIGVNLISPIVPGTYQGFWAMHNPDGQQFGQRIWVGIEVPGPPTSTPPPTQTPNPSINFTVDKTQITAGECVTFSWNVRGADQVYFYEQGEAWPNYPVNHFVTDRLECPVATMTYELRVEWPNGATEIRPQPIFVDPVPEAPVITSFSLTPPNQITLGQCVVLSWTVIGNVDTVVLSRDGGALWEGAPSTGTYQDCPEQTGQVGYLLDATGPGGQSRNQQYIQVNTAVPTAFPTATATNIATTSVPTSVATATATSANLPTIDLFTAMPEEIREGECVTVRWRVSSKATMVTIFRNSVVVGDQVGLNGSVVDCHSVAGVVLYRIEASSASGGVAFDDAAVTVNPANLPGLPLRNTDWTLTHYFDGVGALIAILPDTEIDARFGNDNRVTGSAGCNTYEADYQLDETRLTVGAVSGTNVVCSQPVGIMEQEQLYLNVLRAAATYRIVGNTLEVKNGDGTIILRYQGE